MLMREFHVKFHGKKQVPVFKVKHFIWISRAKKCSFLELDIELRTSSKILFCIAKLAFCDLSGICKNTTSKLNTSFLSKKLQHSCNKLKVPKELHFMVSLMDQLECKFALIYAILNDNLRCPIQ